MTSKWTVAVCVAAAAAFGNVTFSAEIHRAAYLGDLAKVKSLLRDDPGLAFSKSSTNDPVPGYEHYGFFPCYGYTALHVAAAQGNEQIAELLLAKKADVNAKDNGKLTPLHMAANLGHHNLVKLLLTNGADIYAKDVGGHTPLHSAAMQARKDVVGLLLANKAEVNAHDAYGFTPLHLVAQLNDKNGIETTEVLLANGAEVNAVSNDGDTPLHFGALLGGLETVKLLMGKKADVNAKNKKGQTPLARAAGNRQTNMVEFLRQQGGHE
jgi:ankyrin repeat protein